MSSLKSSVAIPWKADPFDFAVSGVVRTVFQSPHIVEFPVRLSGIVPQGGAGGLDIYIGRAFGPTIDVIDGVPAGSSGSPVYIGGRLIGAVSYLFEPDAKLIGVTPIESMLALKNEPGILSEARGSRAVRSYRLKENEDWKKGPSPLAGCTAHEGPFMLPVVGGFLFHRPLRSVERALARRLSLVPQIGRRVSRSIALQPGAPFGVGLLTGDLRLGFIGTVTTVIRDQVFALGHPALFSGPTRLPLTEAEIFETARGTLPRKIGDLGRVVGTVLQDRGAGIYGRLGISPDTVHLDLRVTDQDRGVTQRIRADAADMPSLLPTLVGSATNETFLRAMNRVGAGTATWSWHITLNGVSQPIVEEETLFDPFDIGAAVSFAAEELIAGIIRDGDSIEKIGLRARVTESEFQEGIG